jgi:BirA family biotin operon repressor/biotin-[acetyl-CoA-carboxylase] ligase
MLKFEINNYENLTSTNTILKEQAKLGAKEGKVVTADTQTQGKGSKGRSFYSEKGGLYFSILLRPNHLYYKYLTPLVAVSVSKATESLGFGNIEIKWVNDIFLNGKKVCGILTEGGFDQSNNYYAIVGIGLNLSKTESGFTADIKDTATYLYPTPVPESARLKLLNAILNNIASLYANIEKKEYLDYYLEKSYLTNKQVQINAGNSTFDGTVIGISDEFELLVKNTQNQLITLDSGDVQAKITCNTKHNKV